MAEWPCCHDPLRFSPTSLRFVPPPSNSLLPSKKPRSCSPPVPGGCARGEAHGALSEQAPPPNCPGCQELNLLVGYVCALAWLFAPGRPGAGGPCAGPGATPQRWAYREGPPPKSVPIMLLPRLSKAHCLGVRLSVFEGARRNNRPRWLPHEHAVHAADATVRGLQHVHAGRAATGPRGSPHTGGMVLKIWVPF